ncbi:MAG: DnaA N-terminal domain-containing protein [Clostridium celatum]|nr:DnaA N-terminal domain-containing protein [Clostridium celatum]
MSIIRIVKDKYNPYVMISKEVINNPNLSFKAKGIFTYLMGKPDNWTCQVTDIIKHGKDGKASVYSALKELREHGYMIKQPIRNEKGVITSWEELIFENPSDEAIKIYKEQLERRKKKKIDNVEIKPLPENQKMDENPLSENQKMDENYNLKPLSENQKMDKNPLSENQKMDEINDIPHSNYLDMEYPHIVEPDVENCEILINNDYNNNYYNNNDYSNKEDISLINSSSYSFDEVKKRLKPEISSVSMRTWIDPLMVSKFNDKELILIAPNNFSKEIIDSRYLKLLEMYSGVKVSIDVDI